MASMKYYFGVRNDLLRKLDRLRLRLVCEYKTVFDPAFCFCLIMLRFWLDVSSRAVTGDLDVIRLLGRHVG